MNYFAGIDVGTGSLKTTVMDENGEVVSENSVEYTFKSTSDGGAEQNPQEWIDALRLSLAKARDEKGIDLHQIGYICPTGMQRSLVLLDENCAVLRDAIIWSDARCAPYVQSLNAEHGELIYDIAKTLMITASTLPRFMWLREQEPDILRKTKKFVFPSNYIGYYLTGRILMDRNNASASSIYNMEKHEWSMELAELSGSDPSIFPELADGKELLGYVSEKAAAETGLRKGTPVLTGVADTAAELYSIGFKDSENCMIRLGSAGSLVRVVSWDEFTARKRNECTEYNLYPDTYFDGNYMLTCASAVKWTRDLFFSELEKNSEAFSIMDREATDVRAGSDGVMFHPFLLGENSPYYNSEIRAMFHGLTMSHERKNILRAVYEGTAYCFKNILKKNGAFEKCKSIFITGGGTKSSLWLSILVDVLGKQGVVPKHCDAAYGAALLAGEAGGAWDTPYLLEKNMKENRIVSPTLKNTELYDSMFPRFRSIAENAIKETAGNAIRETKSFNI